MKFEAIHLTTPLSEAQVRALRSGDIVSMNGVIWTCRSRFHKEFIEQGNVPPIDTNQWNVMIHSGPIVEQTEGGYRIRALSITSSIRFEHWEPETIRRLRLRTIIGKGSMGPATIQAMQEVGCVHMTRTGDVSGAYATMVERVREGHWLHLGWPEALWVLEVKDFGPLVVEIDAHGHCLYDSVREEARRRLEQIYEKLGIAGFEYNPR